MILERFIDQVLLEESFNQKSEDILASSGGNRRPSLEKLINGLSEDPETKKEIYLVWGAKQINGVADSDVERATDEVVSLIKDFHALKSGLERKDISQYRTTQDLKDVLISRQDRLAKKQKKSEKLKSLAQIKEENMLKAISESMFLIGGDTPESLRSANLIVVHPRSVHASQYWSNPEYFGCDLDIAAGRTRWCTGATEGPNAFMQYSEDKVVLFYVIDKTKPVESPYYKIAFACVKDPRVDYSELVDGQDEVEDDDDDSSYEQPVPNVEVFDSMDDPISLRDAERSLGYQRSKRVAEEILNFMNSGVESASFPELEKKRKEIEEARDAIISGDLEAVQKNFEDPDLMNSIASSDYLTPDIVRKIMSTESYLKNPGCMASILKKYDVTDEEFYKVLKIFLEGKYRDHIMGGEWHIGDILLKSEKLKTKDIDQIARRLDPKKKYRIVSNENMSDETLQYLVDWFIGNGDQIDEGDQFIFALEIAKKTGVSTEDRLKILEMPSLSKKARTEIYMSLVLDSSTPTEVLDYLYDLGRRSTKIDSYALGERDLAAFAKNPATPARILLDLTVSKNAYDLDKRHARLVYANPSCPPEAFEKTIDRLIRTPSHYQFFPMLEAMCKNPSTPTSVLEKISKADVGFLYHPSADDYKKIEQLRKDAKEALAQRGVQTEALIRSLIRQMLRG